MRISVFTVMLPDLTPEEAAAALEEYGYDGVEWRVTNVPPGRRNDAPSFWGNNYCTLAPTPEEAARARHLAEAHNLAIPSLGTYIAVGDLDATAQAMEFARIAGSPQIRVGVGRSEGTESYTTLFDETRAYLRDVEAMARETGIRALIETHHRTITASASAAYRLVEPFDPAHIAVLYDPGNMVHEGFEEYRFGFDILGPYLAHVHLKNGAFERGAGGVWKGRWSPLDDGVVDMRQLFDALAEIGYDGWIGIEDFSGVRLSRAALESNLAFTRQFLS